MHILTPNEREHVIVLSCINNVGESILTYYIFRSKRMKEIYIKHCEDGASMAMQLEVWMINIYSHVGSRISSGH